MVTSTSTNQRSGSYATTLGSTSYRKSILSTPIIIQNTLLTPYLEGPTALTRMQATTCSPAELQAATLRNGAQIASRKVHLISTASSGRLLGRLNQIPWVLLSWSRTASLEGCILLNMRVVTAVRFQFSWGIRRSGYLRRGSTSLGYERRNWETG